ncbi:MAG: aldehyde dehydrogenase family protein, partial [Pseudomonadota bacterium]
MSNEIRGSLVNGHWLNDGEVFNSINPANKSEMVGRLAKASPETCDAALKAARGAFPSWALTPLETRQAILDTIGRELIDRSKEIGTLVSREEGKPIAEGIGEVYRAGQFFQYYAGEVLRQMGELTTSVRPGVSVEVSREP